MRMTQSDVDAYNHRASLREQRRARGEHSEAVTGMYEEAAMERDLHMDIKRECDRRGWQFVHCRMDRPTSCGVGTPDFVIAMDNGETLWVEAKRGGAKLRPEQLAWMAALKRLGQRAVVVRSLGELLLAVDGGLI